MKKRIAAIVLILILCGCMLAGCGGASKVEGTTWTLTSGEFGNEKVSKNQIMAEFGKITYQFHRDGVVTISYAGRKRDGKYVQDGSHIVVDNGQTKTEGTIHGNRMTFKSDEIDITTVFTRN